MVGTTISHYSILEKLGEGGMGVVYKARDTELGRLVAVKVLRTSTEASDDDRKRLLQEARATSVLSHPNIITVYEIGHASQIDFIVMEYVNGMSLERLLVDRGLPLERAVSFATQLASALAAAHGAGIVHRDIKPANILVTSEGQVKVLDFGLAKATGRPLLTETESTLTVAPETRNGLLVGTIRYMSPEQAQGQRVDAKTDIFSLGLVFYEMLAGQHAFRAASDLSALIAIVRDSPPPLNTFRPDLPGAIEVIINRALSKQREARPSAADLLKDLRHFERSEFSLASQPLPARARQPRVLITALLLLAAVVASVGWWLHRGSRDRWVRGHAVPEISRLVQQGRFSAAFDLAQQAESQIPGDPELERLFNETSRIVSIQTLPSGADVYRKEYDAPDSEWRYVGKTPLERVAVPRGYYRYRFQKEGFDVSLELAPENPIAVDQRFSLSPRQEVPAGMVHVPTAPRVVLSLNAIGRLDLSGLEHYFIDRYEVTNKQFKAFVDSGGYRKKEYWKQAFVDGNRTLSWEDAMNQFRDATGRPGPSTWDAGNYKEGQEELPVSGVSWYEAAAFAEFAGKQLPTLYHWYRAADLRTGPWTVPVSNFGGSGPARRGHFQGIGPFGTLDMAGNVKEWCWNETGDGQRFLLGGSWNSPGYMFNDQDAREPFDRSATNGFRCARYCAPIATPLMSARHRLRRDFSKEKPASDEVFRAYRSLYSYDFKELRPKIEETDETSQRWKKEKISFDAVYGNERVIAYLFLPRSAPPPYQAVIYFPGSNAEVTATSAKLVDQNHTSTVISSGRAFLYPVYQGTHERSGPRPTTPVQARNRTVQRVQDLKRSLDYLETRPDISRDKLAYLGVSMGANHAPVMLALEERFKTAVLLDGGFPSWALGAPGLGPLPETDPFNFAPRVKIPVLMLNGRYDFTFPVEMSQIPMFRLLATPEGDKRHLLLNTAHEVSGQAQAVSAILDWLDRYLGLVKP